MMASQATARGLGRKNRASDRLVVVIKSVPIHMLMEQYTSTSSQSLVMEAISPERALNYA